jgi:hypothetical protein
MWLGFLRELGRSWEVFSVPHLSVWTHRFLRLLFLRLINIHDFIDGTKGLLYFLLRCVWKRPSQMDGHFWIVVKVSVMTYWGIWDWMISFRYFLQDGLCSFVGFSYFPSFSKFIRRIRVGLWLSGLLDIKNIIEIRRFWNDTRRSCFFNLLRLHEIIVHHLMLHVISFLRKWKTSS